MQTIFEYIYFIHIHFINDTILQFNLYLNTNQLIHYVGANYIFINLNFYNNLLI